jgi:glycosyltransferase involved in cell wall biosynthesis
VFYGFDNWEKVIAATGNAEQIRFRDEIKAKLNQPGVTVFGRVDQNRLAQEMAMGGVWAYPAHFWETFCITALEAQASGLAVVTSSLAGLTDSVKTGLFIGQGDRPISHHASWSTVHSAEYKEAFVKNVLKVLRDDMLMKQLSSSGRDASLSSSWTDEQTRSSFSWEDVAFSWRARFLT